jgi:hypothetical protein
LNGQPASIAETVATVGADPVAGCGFTFPADAEAAVSARLTDLVAQTIAIQGCHHSA